MVRPQALTRALIRHVERTLAKPATEGEGRTVAGPNYVHIRELTDTRRPMFA